MITISDLNVSRENCLTELKDAEMMGHIIGGFFNLSIGGIGFSLGNQLAVDLDADGTIEPGEIFSPFRGTLGFSIDFGDLLQRNSH
ncbi:MAG: hypothetical protein F6J90_01905 [Moorea sp. SIOASIH]|uniref:hypothetical protein n=1 Tax=Moorena sp. SIOASIH TaxID=2607817 RepID=UPI0013B64ABF|nr:hypothetical protein [Moorena sp. SIOASIH]NEO35123.1 hypothetical protein [Moorena sp. SIOASIH]